jgi:hypothetical protein
LGVRGKVTPFPIGLVAGVTGNITLLQFKAVPQPVVAAQAVKVGGLLPLAVVTVTLMTPKPGSPFFKVPPLE